MTTLKNQVLTQILLGRNVFYHPSIWVGCSDLHAGIVICHPRGDLSSDPVIQILCITHIAGISRIAPKSGGAVVIHGGVGGPPPVGPLGDGARGRLLALGFVIEG